MNEPPEKLDSLDNKFRLATVAPLDRRMKRKHLAVYGFLLDWYHRKYGDALASVRHIAEKLKERDPAGLGLYIGDIHAALKDLEAWGYITATVGTGRQASRYVPVWAPAHSVRENHNTTAADGSVRGNHNTSVRETPNTTASSVREMTNEDPLTGPGHKTEVRLSGDLFEDAAAPPPPDGLGATGAVPSSGDEFDDFWQIWPRKHGRLKTKAEWAKIVRDPEEIIEAAQLWAAHYARLGTETRWIPEPANWLRDERWMEDLPLIHADGKSAAIAEAQTNESMPVEADTALVKPEPHDTPDPFAVLPDEHTSGIVERVEDSVSEDDGAKMLSVWFRTPDGREVEHFMVYESPDLKEQEHGQKTLEMLLDATGPVADPGDLVGREVDLVINRKEFVSCTRPSRAAA